MVMTLGFLTFQAWGEGVKYVIPQKSHSGSTSRQ